MSRVRPFENHKATEGAPPSQAHVLVKCQRGQVSDLLLVSFCDRSHRSPDALEKYHQAVQSRGQSFFFNTVERLEVRRCSSTGYIYFPDSSW